jgi:hypothetical protein
MAKPTTARPGAFIISLWNGSAFTAPCGFTSKSFRWNRSLAEVNIPDCDDPDAAAWVGRDVESLSASVNGDGILAAEAIPTWMNVLNTIDAVQVQIEITYTTGVLTVTGDMQLTTLEVGAQQGQKVNISVSMDSDGEMETEWNPA